jgi:hypothetical protein
MADLIATGEEFLGFEEASLDGAVDAVVGKIFNRKDSERSSVSEDESAFDSTVSLLFALSGTAIALSSPIPNCLCPATAFIHSCPP